MPVTPPEPEEPESSGSKFLDEPPPVQPVQPPPAGPEMEVSEDEAQREEARRFARLLISEIKLYNEEQVEQGRESNDIYQRLREDIDRSREMFDKRISAEVRESQDYFQDELVRVLADGDPDLLGM
jgi:translation initiation factor 2 beta subunit (eIF-2beta)/eIF-5